MTDGIQQRALFLVWSGFVVTRQFFSRLFAIQEHVVIHLNCFYRIRGLIVDSIFPLFVF